MARLAVLGKTVILTTLNVEQAYRRGHAAVSLISGGVTAASLINVLRKPTTRPEGQSHFESDGLRIEMAGGVNRCVISIDPEDVVETREALRSGACNCCAGDVVRADD